MLFPFLLALNLSPDGCVLLDRDSIVASDLAAIVPAFAQMPADFNVGYVSASGTARILHGTDLERLAANRGIISNGYKDVCFARRTFVPSPEEISKAMLATVTELWGRTDPRTASAKITVLSSSQRPVPQGDMVFAAEGIQWPPGITDPAEVTWHGSVRYGEGNTAPVWAKVKISAVVTRVVAIRDIPAGKLIQANQVRVETHEGFPLDDTLASKLEDVVNYLPKSLLRAHGPIHKTQVVRPPDVARGDLVRVQVIDGPMRLMFEGTAQTPGVTGGVIMVRNTSSGKDFRAQVTGKGRATVPVGDGGRAQ